jgi:hypothetical protein
MAEDILATLDLAAPPSALSAPLQAMWWLKKGDLQLGNEWIRAHEICQTAEGVPAYDWVHALAHLIEQDLPNAAYWYRRSNRVQGTGTLDEEWTAIVAGLMAPAASR